MELRAVAGPEGAPGARAQLAVVCLGEWAARAAEAGPGSRRPRRPDGTLRPALSLRPGVRGGAGELGACWVAAPSGDAGGGCACRRRRAPGASGAADKGEAGGPLSPPPPKVSFFCP